MKRRKNRGIKYVIVSYSDLGRRFSETPIMPPAGAELLHAKEAAALMSVEKTIMQFSPALQRKLRTRLAKAIYALAAFNDLWLNHVRLKIKTHHA